MLAVCHSVYGVQLSHTKWNLIIVTTKINKQINLITLLFKI